MFELQICARLELIRSKKDMKKKLMYRRLLDIGTEEAKRELNKAKFDLISFDLMILF